MSAKRNPGRWTLPRTPNLRRHLGQVNNADAKSVKDHRTSSNSNWVLDNIDLPEIECDSKTPKSWTTHLHIRRTSTIEEPTAVTKVFLQKTDCTDSEAQASQ
jgi:hypothetical protein